MEVIDQNNMGNKVRESRKGKDLPNIALSNSFGNLGEDMESGELRKGLDTYMDVGASESRVNEKGMEVNVGSGNKENIAPDFVIEEAIDGENASGLVFRASSGPHPNPSRLGSKNKKHENGKSAESGRPKKANLTRPARGLVFGPAKGELELSTSGKRLRVKQGAVGRSGGFIVTGRTFERENHAPEKNSLVETMDAQMGKEGSLSAEE
ncbi:unnamed protein product [Microthlaspi erraticum]|uniref:Uncharacterized protein n=1 Tax=Microthlaspi erraticum TaxID=1685480 RepID=A0A6D2KYK5_9BRAS|nr:unnamed protein product [Microthlaspi erraticum]